MLRRAISTLALTAVLAAPATAQVPSGPFPFEFAGAAGQYDDWSGSFNGGSTFFQVFCVDFLDEVGHPSDAYDVWVTPYGAADMSFIDQDAGAWANYRQAAQLASIMIGGAPAGADKLQIQQAIWYAMGFNPSGAFFNEYDTWYNGNGLDAQYTRGADIVISDDDWYVINGEFGGEMRQELIAFRADPPQETVPEPATMTLLATGLAGMAAARRRRKS